MYGSSKDDGVIIGEISKGQCSLDMGEVVEVTSAEESLLGYDEKGNKIAMTSTLNYFGDLTWEPEIYSDFVIERTICMGQMASMVLDFDRNIVYQKDLLAIERCIQNFQLLTSSKPRVLDIGTGTGLLAMFSCRSGADSVIACEMFEPMAEIAKIIIQDNGFHNQIEVVSSKSTDLESIPLVDVIISELLDSALLGESCIMSHADAIDRLLNLESPSSSSSSSSPFFPPVEDRVVPHHADIYVSLIESQELCDMIRVDSLDLGGASPWRNIFADSCQGGWGLVPVHWPRLAERGGRTLSQAHKLHTFEFFHGIRVREGKKIKSERGKENNASYGMAEGGGGSGDEEQHWYEDQDQDQDQLNPEEENSPSPTPFGSGSSSITLKSASSGQIHGLLLWWKVSLLSPRLDPENELTYSTEPGINNWQDHWQQVVFPLPSESQFFCAEGESFQLKLSHDHLRMWMRLERIENLFPCDQEEIDAQEMELKVSDLLDSFPSASSSPYHSSSTSSSTIPLTKKMKFEKNTDEEKSINGEGGGDEEEEEEVGDEEGDCITPPRKEWEIRIKDIENDVSEYQDNEEREGVGAELGEGEEESEGGGGGGGDEREDEGINPFSSTEPPSWSEEEKWFESPQCLCGWHVLYGPERLLTLNDREGHTSILHKGVDLIVDEVIRRIHSLVIDGSARVSEASGNNPETNHGTEEDSHQRQVYPKYLLLDVSDGSIASIFAAKRIQSLILAASSPSPSPSLSSSVSFESSSLSAPISLINSQHLVQCVSSLQIVSREKKFFSKLFHEQLLAGNELLLHESEEETLSELEEEEEELDEGDGKGDEELKENVINKVLEKDDDDESVKVDKQIIDPQELKVQSSVGRVMVWEGRDLTDWSELIQRIDPPEKKEDDNNNMQEEEEEKVIEFLDKSPVSPSSSSSSSSTSSPSSQIHPTPPSPKILALVSECFHFQLHSLPTVEALSFLHQRRSLNPFMHPFSLVFPAQARVMVAPLEMPKMRTSHRLVGNVSGFDFSKFDEKQQNWHSFYYPYKLAQYEKLILANPTCVRVLDYNIGTHFHPLELISSFNEKNTKSVNNENNEIESTQFDTILPISLQGECDAIAIWVDYVLPLPLSPSLEIEIEKRIGGREWDHLDPSFSGLCLKQWDPHTREWTPHSRCLLKFFPTPISVSPPSSSSSSSSSIPQFGSKLKVMCRLNSDATDFEFNFDI